MKDAGFRVLKLPARSPNLNAFAERFVRSIKEECLDQFILFGERSLRKSVKEYLEHFHAERPHQERKIAYYFNQRKPNLLRKRIQVNWS